jgi:dihydroneopterin aldolase
MLAAGRGVEFQGGFEMDIVFLHGLRVDTVIGVFEWERKIKQAVIIDLEMATNVARAAETDELSDALDYKAVAHRVTQSVAESRFQLVETLTERVAAIVRHEFGCPWVRVKLNKRGAITGAEDVGIIIERGSRG